MPLSYLDTDNTLAADSDAKVASQKAVKAYIGTMVTSAMHYKGVVDCSGNPNYPAASLGDVYVVSVAGKIGGASGLNVEAGDTLLCKETTVSGDQATVGSKWDVIQVNIDGAVTGPASSTDNAIALFNSTSGKVIKNSLATVDTNGSMNIPTGQAYKINNVDIMTGVTKKYAATFNNTTDWSGAGPYTVTIAAATHGLGATANLMVQVKELSGSDYNVVEVDIQTQADGDVVITSAAKFTGSYVLIG